MTVFLQVVGGPRRGANLLLESGKALVVGRRRGDVLLDDPLVSGAHCRITHRDGNVTVQDLGSTNGTQVDGRIVREATLRPGAEIQIGSTRMILFVGDAPSQDAEAEATRPREDVDAVAWLLDQELVDTRTSRQEELDIIKQELRLPPGLQPCVEVVAGPDAGKVFRLLRGSATIGRRTGEVPLSDGEVSRHHAIVEVFGREMIFLRDLGSTNGTYHNGRRVAVARLKSGDAFGCGRSVMRWTIPVS